MTQFRHLGLPLLGWRLSRTGSSLGESYPSLPSRRAGQCMPSFWPLSSSSSLHFWGTPNWPSPCKGIECYSRLWWWLLFPHFRLYRGTLRVLLVLLHDFPEFLCDYHYGFCDVIPPNCIQMRNLILSAFPRNMRLPDPLTLNLKVK